MEIEFSYFTYFSNPRFGNTLARDCSKTVVVPYSKRGKLDHDGVNRCAGKRVEESDREFS